jgi:hypothetical protein
MQIFNELNLTIGPIFANESISCLSLKSSLDNT